MTWNGRYLYWIISITLWLLYYLIFKEIKVAPALFQMFAGAILYEFIGWKMNVRS